MPELLLLDVWIRLDDKYDEIKSQYYQIPNKSQVPENEKKRVVIARKEAKETKYWLRLISEKFINKKIIIKDINETQELVNILNAIIRNSKCNH